MKRKQFTKGLVPVLLILTVLSCCLSQFMLLAQNPQDKKITSLPGYDKTIPFNTYTGYLTANATRGHYLFYFFAESQGNPKTDPVIFWTNGGPGCSSMAGMATEHGPFLVGVPNGGKRFSVYDNPYSWNRRANMIYVEQPIGVGYSYSDNEIDYSKVTDDTATKDFANAIRDFFNHFPQFVNNDVYISGESYGGVYVPITATHVMNGNADGKYPRVNLKGIMVGNGITDGESDSNLPTFLRDHSVVTDEQYNRGLRACRGNFYLNQNDPRCSNFLYEVMNQIGVINPYYLYDSCPYTGVNGNVKKMMKKKNKFHALTKTYFPKNDGVMSKNNNGTHPLFELYRYRPATSRRVATHLAMKMSTAAQQQGNIHAMAENDAPCVSDSYIVKYFSSSEVQKALGVRRRTADPNGWLVCTDGPLNYQKIYDSILPFYRQLLPNIRILVYTGDVDAVVNSIGTQKAISKLNLTIAPGFGDSFKQWTHETSNGKIADGYYRKFIDGKGLTFVTVRGAGHMVPQVKPEAAYLMFSRFLDNEF
ncbi:hypothetical protein ABK040_006602 [Willaertia magna]